MLSKFLFMLPWGISKPLLPFFVFLKSLPVLIRLRRHAARSTDHILIYSLEKTGSCTINTSLRKKMPGAWLYQTHRLKNSGVLSDPFKVEALRLKKHLVLNGTCDQRALFKILKDKDFSKKVRIISLVRDPVAGNISHFFYRLYAMGNHPEISCEELRKKSPQEQVALIMPIYLKDPYFIPGRKDWFASEMRPLLGLDVYKTPFAKERGYQVYVGEHPPVLILKLEKLASVAREAVQGFLGIPDFELVPAANTAAEAGYATAYEKFLERLVLPQPYLDEIYAARYVNHFYTKAEIRNFRKRWEHDPR